MPFHPLRLRRLAFAVMLAALAGPTGAAEPDTLDAYVARLRADYAGPRRETGFLSAGSDFLYGQDAFEAGNYASAANRFRDVVRQDERNAYAHYQLAVALLRQPDASEPAEAREHAEIAFRLEPALKERFAREVSAATRPAPAAGAAPTEPVPAPTTPAPASGAWPPQAADALSRYLARLKASAATGGAETAMNTAGQAALQAIQYYERNDFRGAETDLRLALAREPANPFLNYLFAVALAAQGKAEEAAPFRQRALAAEPSLEARYATELPRARAAWQQAQAAKALPPPPAAEQPVFGGPLVIGKYVCSQTVWNGPNVSPAFRSEYKGYFELRSDGTYRWLDDGPVGRYRYDAQTGRIEWLSGHLRDQPRETRFQAQGKSGQITLTFSDTYRWSCYCEVK